MASSRKRQLVLWAVSLAVLLGLLPDEWPPAMAQGEKHNLPRLSFSSQVHKLKASDTAHLHYVSASGSLLYEEGQASGTLPGTMRVHLDVGAVFRGSFTIRTRAGTITGRGVATPHGSGAYESFAGSLVITGGSGRYAQAHGRAGLYGTFSRSDYRLLVQTTGTLLY
jgi:hypothetical protein